MSKKEQVEQLTDYMANFVSYIAKVLPDDIIAKLDELAEKEDSPLSKVIYETMKKNQVLAKELNRPSCQDTGVLQFWVKCGTNFPLIGELETLLKEAVINRQWKHRFAITAWKHLTSTIQAKMSEKEHRQYSGILYQTVIGARFILTWQAADAHFRGKPWC